MRQRAYATGIILIVSCAYLQGCAAIVGGAAYGVEKIYLAEDRSPIYVTENDNAVVGCVFMMDVKGKRLLGGPFLQDQTLERVIADLTIEIYEGGANVLLIKEKSKGFWGSSVVGKGYRCKTIPAPPPKPININGGISPLPYSYQPAITSEGLRDVTICGRVADRPGGGSSIMGGSRWK